MDLPQLKGLAKEAIDCVNKNPFSQRLGLAPAVQVKSLKPVENFPVKFKYVGVNPEGQHVYNLDAREIIKL